MTRAIRSCLEDASLEPSAIDLVASGLSGLKPFDTVELAAINEVLGKDACIAMPKALVGETLGAGGAMAMACALGWLQGIAPAAVISGKTPAKVKTVLVTTMGYYGNASAVILRASDRT
jgi:3-oxoacyl-[acyl-carrier-protein] synthase II